MAKDTEETKTKKKTTTTATKKSSTKTSGAKKKATTAAASPKAAPKTKAVEKPATKKATTKKAGTAAKKNTTSAKKKTSKKVTEPVIEREDLEKGEADLAKTVIINKEIIEAVRKDEEIESLNIKEEKSKKKEISAKTILGLDLPSDKSKESFKERNSYYLKDALIFAIIVPLVDLMAMLFIDSYKPLLITNSVPLNIMLTVLMDFILIFVITYLIDYIFGEDAVRRINK